MLGVACCGLGVGLISPRPFDDEFSAGQPKLDQAPGARREARWQAMEPCGALHCSATQGTCGTGRTGQYGWSHDCSELASHCPVQKSLGHYLPYRYEIFRGRVLLERTSTWYLVSNIVGFNCTCFFTARVRCVGAWQFHRLTRPKILVSLQASRRNVTSYGSKRHPGSQVLGYYSVARIFP